MKYLILIVMTFLASMPRSVVAQSQEQSVAAFFNQSNGFSSLEGGNNAFYVKPNSSMYVKLEPAEVYQNPEWREGEITNIRGQRYEGIPLRYRIPDDVFEFRYEGKYYDINRETVRKITIAGETYIPTTYRWKRTPMIGYLQSLYAGEDYGLLKRYYCLWQEPRRNDLLDVGEEHKSLKQRSAWLVTTPEGEQDIPTTTGSQGILRKLGLKSDNAVKAFIRENELDLSEDADFARLLDWLDNQ
jgi:hypothetical protein